MVEITSDGVAALRLTLSRPDFNDFYMALLMVHMLSIQAEFLVPMKVVTVFCSLEVVTFSEP